MRSGIVIAAALAALSALIASSPGGLSAPRPHRGDLPPRADHTAGRQAPDDPPPPARESVGLRVYVDLLIALVNAGMAARSATRLIEEHLHHFGLGAPSTREEILSTIELAERSGLAPTALLRALAEAQQRRRTAAARLAAARLAVRALLPVGLCLLPAFMALSVVPLVIGLAG